MIFPCAVFSYAMGIPDASWVFHAPGGPLQLNLYWSKTPKEIEKGKKNNQYIGRSPFNQSVYFSSYSENENLIGSFIDLNITKAFQNSLSGNIISNL